MADSVNPEVIGRGIKQLIADPPNPWEMFESIAKGMLHYDELKGIYDAWRNHDSYEAGYYLGKLIVDAGTQIILTVVTAGAGAAAAKAFEKVITGSERAAKATKEAANGGGVLAKYDADLALGQLTRGGRAKASELDEFGSSQGWIRSQTESGPVKFRDENGIVRLTIKRGSQRAAVSGDPHVEMRNALGKRVDPYGIEVTRKSLGNHTPIIWDW